MGFQHRLPAPPLDALVATIWDWDVLPAAHRYERVLPQPGAQLIINLHEDETRVYSDDDTWHCTRSSGSVFGGPGLRSEIIDTAEQVRVMGVVFRPGGAHALTGEDASTLTGRDTDLADLFGSSAARLRQRLLETADAGTRLQLLELWLLHCLRGPPLDSAVAHALATLDRLPQVTRIPLLARDTGLSERRLGLLFHRQVGMGPKRYARLMRFRAVVAQAQKSPTVNWSHVAADCGYCDQAHLTHEFRRFAGITPSAFMAARGPYLNHLPIN